jgi:hypothetical protein
LNAVVLGTFLWVATDEVRRSRRGDGGARAVDAKSVALSELLASPEPRSTPYTLVLAELRARQIDDPPAQTLAVPTTKEVTL